jgi:hypothetical protein
MPFAAPPAAMRAATARAVLTEAGRGALFLAALGAHLRDPIAVDAAAEAVQRRLASREADFLAVVRDAVFRHAGSPYRPLFKRAGCQFGDLTQLVNRVGLEAALAALAREGVFLTVPETRGERLAIRGETRVAADLERLRNPCWSAPHPIRLGWSPRWQAMLADMAVNATLVLAARGGTGWRHAHWFRPSPSTWIVWHLRYQGRGYGPDRCYTRVDVRKSPNRLERLLPRAVGWIGRLAGVPMPAPEFVPLEDPSPILDWIQAVRRNGGIPHLSTTASGAVHVCQLARGRGMDLREMQFSVSAEPLTAARLAVIRAAGAAVVPAYGATEANFVAYGCLEPVEADDMHLYDDVHAAIPARTAGAPGGLPPDALLLSSLRRSSAYVLINVSLGDQATLAPRACQCPLERLGWRTHVHTVRSFDKLKIGGVNIPTEALMRLLESELPARCGGGPTDFQLIEEEQILAGGTSRLVLCVHPRVPGVGTDAVREAFIAGVRALELPLDRLWRDPGWLVVMRREPRTSSHGKLYHVLPAGVPEETRRADG